MSSYSRTDYVGKGGSGKGGGSSYQDQIAALTAQLAELQAHAAAEKSKEAASSSGPSPVAAKPAPVAVPPGSTGEGSVGGGGRYRKPPKSEDRSSSASSSAATTTSCFRSGQAPINIPKVATNYHPMPINPMAVKKAVGVAVPPGSTPFGQRDERLLHQDRP